jgi:hypothetical protein
VPRVPISIMAVEPVCRMRAGHVRRLVSTCCDAKRGWSIVTSSKSSTRFWFFDCQDFKESPCFLFALVLRIRSSITSIAVLEANAIGRPETVAVMSGTRTI